MDAPTLIARRGLMFALSSPSGAGKTTISRRMLACDDALELSVSVTTRPPRPGEADGVDYRFLDEATFGQMAINGEFLEHARVFDHHYGTPRAPMEKALAAGKDVLFDIDWQGTRQLAQSARDDLVSVFILPPSLTELHRRLKARAQDSDEIVARRMAKSIGEISHWNEYDYVIVNTDVEESLADVLAILRAERLRRTRRVGMETFVETLVEG